MIDECIARSRIKKKPCHQHRITTLIQYELLSQKKIDSISLLFSKQN